MIPELFAVTALALLCAAWVVVQRAVRRVDPGQPGVEGCAGCRHADSCER